MNDVKLYSIIQDSLTISRFIDNENKTIFRKNEWKRGERERH